MEEAAVASAIATLQRQGKRPSITKIRRALGGGSNRDIIKHRDAVLAATSTEECVPTPAGTVALQQDAPPDAAAAPLPLLAQAEKDELEARKAAFQLRRAAQEPGSPITADAVWAAKKRLLQAARTLEQRQHGKRQLATALPEAQRTLYRLESDLAADEAESATRLARKRREVAQERESLHLLETQWVDLTGEEVPVETPR
jgi:hypothetical protein